MLSGRSCFNMTSYPVLRHNFWRMKDHQKLDEQTASKTQISFLYSSCQEEAQTSVFNFLTNVWIWSWASWANISSNFTSLFSAKQHGVALVLNVKLCIQCLYRVKSPHPYILERKRPLTNFNDGKNNNQCYFIKLPNSVFSYCFDWITLFGISLQYIHLLFKDMMNLDWFQ